MAFGIELKEEELELSVCLKNRTQGFSGCFFGFALLNEVISRELTRCRDEVILLYHVPAEISL